MKKFVKIFLLTLLLFINIWNLEANFDYSNNNLLAVNNVENINELDSWNIKPEWNQVDNNDRLDKIKDDKFMDSSQWWVKWILNMLIKVARDMKNVFFLIAGLYLLVLILRLLFLEKTDEEVAKFKKWVLWTTLWIMVMQISFSFDSILFDKDVNENLAYNLIDKLVNPLISLVETAASFFFLAIAIYAFYRIITADWEDDKITTWKKSIIYAVVWFVVIKFSKAMVEATYGKLNSDCEADFWFNFVNESCLIDADIWWVANIVVTIINWLNGFIAVIVLVLIIYAWFILLTSAWDEEKLKKTKSIILYIAIWMALLVTNYLIFTFFLIPESPII